MRGVWVVCAVAMALSASPASAQEEALPGETFAAYALDFCAAIADGQTPQQAQASASPGARLEGPRPAGNDADLIGRDIQAARDTPIFILGRPDNDRTRVVMAFARADGERCVTFAGEGEGALDALRHRLSAEGGTWQANMAVGGAEMFVRNVSQGEGAVQLLAVAGDATHAARVLTERRPRSVTMLTRAQRQAWAEHIVTHCAAALHERRALTDAEMAPFFERASRQGDTLTLDETVGQPGGVLFLNSGNGNACMLTMTSGGLPDLQAALVEALTARGAHAQGDGTYRLRKPSGMRGRDAVFTIGRTLGPLMIAVRGG